MAGLLRNITSRYLISCRTLARNTVYLEKIATTSTPPPAATPVAAAADAAVHSGKLSGKTHRVNSLERRFLVWSGKYKTMDEVPSYVAPESVEKARNKARIRLANIMMLMTALACLGMVISGKRAAERGESVQKANLEWHRRINEEAEKNKK